MPATRRQVMVAGAGGAALAVPAVASAASVDRVGIASDAREAVGVIGTILQDGPQLAGFGYLTHVAGMKARDLFTDPAQRGASTARLLWHANVRVDSLDLLPQLFYGTGEGRLRFFFSEHGGAVEGDPATFTTGRLVARFTGKFRNVQIVYAPDHAITEIVGELTQREARRFEIHGTARRLGRVGALPQLIASGPATRTDPTIPRSTRYVAGGLTFPG